MKKPVLFVTIYDDGSTKTEEVFPPEQEVDIPEAILPLLDTLSKDIEGSSQRIKQVVLTTAVILNECNGIPDLDRLTGLYNVALLYVSNYLGVHALTVRDKYERQLGLATKDVIRLLDDFLQTPEDILGSSLLIRRFKDNVAANKRFEADLDAIDTLVGLKKQI